MVKISYAMLLPLLTSGMLLRAAGSPEEAKKQEEFKKAYSSTDKAERQMAIELLSGLASPSTISLLANCCSDSNKDVRDDAFKLLAKAPARDASVAQQLVSIFQAVRDPEQKQSFAGYMCDSAFKYPIGAALMSLCASLRYPDLLKTKTSPKNDPNDTLRKERDMFSVFFKAFNGVTGAKLPGPDKNSPAAVSKWWNDNSSKIKKTDDDLLKKYKDEQAKADADKTPPAKP